MLWGVPWCWPLALLCSASVEVRSPETACLCLSSSEAGNSLSQQNQRFVTATSPLATHPRGKSRTDARAFRAKPGRGNPTLPTPTPKRGKGDPRILYKNLCSDVRVGVEFQSNHRPITLKTKNGLQGHQRLSLPQPERAKSLSK